MKVIAPFGNPPVGTGTFDCLFDIDKYKTSAEAFAANDYVEGNYIDDNGTLKIEAHHIQRPDDKKYHILNIQRPIFGIDALDDQLACEMMTTLFLKQ